MSKQNQPAAQPEEEINPQVQTATQDTEPEETQTPSEAPVQEEETPLQGELALLQQAIAKQEDLYLRLAAEYDNYRKRTAKEKESLWNDSKAEAVAAFLPVYDNLERALKQQTSDEAYKRGVEMTMTQLKEILVQLGISEIQALGQPFDPNLHNAVMHVEQEAFGENTVCEVFQTGFVLGERVIRFAVVQVAN